MHYGSHLPPHRPHRPEAVSAPWSSTRTHWLARQHPDNTLTPPRPHPDPTPTAPRPRPAPTPAPSSLRKKISALNARKKAAAAQEKLDDAKGLPKWNLFRVLPKQTAGNTRGIDGSLRFPKPWGKQWGSQGLTDDGEKRV